MKIKRYKTKIRGKVKRTEPQIGCGVREREESKMAGVEGS